jgi:hypothetical protein
VQHASIQDLEVTLIVDTNPCTGAVNNFISSYVCIDNFFGGEVSLYNSTPYVANGHYLNYGANGGYMRMHIDLAKIATRTAGLTSSTRDALIDHAVHAGLGWVIGIGSRRDQTQAWNNEVIEDSNRGAGAAAYRTNLFPTTDGCKTRSFRPAGGELSFTLGGYCGWDTAGLF